MWFQYSKFVIVFIFIVMPVVIILVMIVLVTGPIVAPHRRRLSLSSLLTAASCKSKRVNIGRQVFERVFIFLDP